MLSCDFTLLTGSEEGGSLRCFRWNWSAFKSLAEAPASHNPPLPLWHRPHTWYAPTLYAHEYVCICVGTYCMCVYIPMYVCTCVCICAYMPMYALVCTYVHNIMYTVSIMYMYAMTMNHRSALVVYFYWHNHSVNTCCLYLCFCLGVAADLSHICSQAEVTGYVGDEQLNQALEGADVVVIPAGVPRKPGVCLHGHVWCVRCVGGGVWGCVGVGRWGCLSGWGWVGRVVLCGWGCLGEWGCVIWPRRLWYCIYKLCSKCMCFRSWLLKNTLVNLPYHSRLYFNEWTPALLNPFSFCFSSPSPLPLFLIFSSSFPQFFSF